MSADYATLHAALLVFVRISAALMSAPGFGSKSLPVNIRIMVGVALAGALTAMLRPKVAPVPADLGVLVLQVGTEAASGLLIGYAMSLAVEAATIAGNFLDAQIGLSMSQILNPVDGVPTSIIGQVKSMLALVVFLTLDAHHIVLGAIVRSYDAPPPSLDSLPAILHGVQGLLVMAFSVSLQIAAPALGVSLIVDAALALLSRAVPQLQPLQIGMPAKIAAGLLAVTFALPTLVGGVSYGVDAAAQTLGRIFAGGG